ncbi:MAG: hypothetical protein HW421_2375 [Ignavibacteria bacterium]|nr:hypothetical protein [Ignavibacteria bacterium]
MPNILYCSEAIIPKINHISKRKILIKFKQNTPCIKAFSLLKIEYTPIDELKIYSRALLPEEIKALAK